MILLKSLLQRRGMIPWLSIVPIIVYDFPEPVQDIKHEINEPTIREQIRMYDPYVSCKSLFPTLV